MRKDLLALLGLGATAMGQTFSKNFEMEDFPEESEDSEELRQQHGEVIRELSGLDSDEIDRRLGYIFTLVDTNKDSVASREELLTFLHGINKRMDENKVKETMEMLDADGDGFVSFEEAFIALRNDESITEIPASLMKRLEYCDKDKDGKLNAEELGMLMHPGRHAELLAMDVEEYMQDFDHDKDGGITAEEFLKDIEDDARQEAVEEFLEFDKNDDGKMDRQELADWLKEVTLAFDIQRDEAVKAVGTWMMHFAPNGLSEDDFAIRVAQLIAQKATIYGVLLKTPWLVGVQIPGVEAEQEYAEEMDKHIEEASKQLEAILGKQGKTLEGFLEEMGIDKKLMHELTHASAGNTNPAQMNEKLIEAIEKKAGMSLQDALLKLQLVQTELQEQMSSEDDMDAIDFASPEFQAKLRSAMQALKEKGLLPDDVEPMAEGEELERRMEEAAKMVKEARAMFEEQQAKFQQQEDQQEAFEILRDEL